MIIIERIYTLFIIIFRDQNDKKSSHNSLEFIELNLTKRKHINLKYRVQPKTRTFP